MNSATVNHAQTPSKAKSVDIIEEIARMKGEPIFGEDGLRSFGGHPWRVSGARHLARTGVHLLAIMALARWASATVLQYIGDAPINCVTAEYRKLQRERRLGIGTGAGPQIGAEDVRK